jgi:hypothetical protein
MKLYQATALITVFLVKNALSFADKSTALKSSPPQCEKVKQDVPRPDLYIDSNVNLEETVPGLLEGSSLIYGYASLRNLVNKHDRAVNNGVPNKDKGNFLGFNIKEIPLYDFDTPAYIVTQHGSQADRGRYLKYDITAQAILKFLDLNRNLLKDDKNGNMEVEEKSEGEHPPTGFEKLLRTLIERKQDARITEFDDQFNNKELVYGITQDM